jgi:regulator of RNase E activity RraA
VNTKTQLADLIGHDRISSTMACDVMNKTGWIQDITPLNKGHHLAGEVKYVFAHSGTNYHLHEQIAEIDEDKIIFVDAIDCEQRAVMGDIMANYLLQHRRARAIVTNGYLRDVPELIKDNMPIWCKGGTPIGCHKVQTPVPDHVAKFVEERRRLFESSILICDDSGVAMITEEWVNESFYEKISCSIFFKQIPAIVISKNSLKITRSFEKMYNLFEIIFADGENTNEENNDIGSNINLEKFDAIKLGRVRFRVKDFRCDSIQMTEQELYN